MRTLVRCFAVFLLAFLLQAASSLVFAQSNSGIVSGVVTDPSGAVVPNARVTIDNPVSQYTRTAITDASGSFRFVNLPFNPYHVTVNAQGFSPIAQDVDVSSTVPVTLNTKLKVGGASSTVTVIGGQDLLENDPTFHTDIDRNLIDKVPLESQSSSLSSLVTLASPGVAADSNGLFHGLGDHASNSFSIDGQPITDQQSKVFSNQLPLNSIQSLEVISGAPPAEYGGKTSLVIVATTRSGQGITTPTGDIYASYGTFGSSTVGFDLGYGGKNWGNFFEADGLNTGRFLDGPEFNVFHAKGNEQNVFDRVDYSFTPVDSIHLNLNYSRSWFQTPNAYDNLNIQNVISGGSSPNPVFGNVGNTDQKSKIETFDIAPTYTRVIGSNGVLNFGLYARKDFYNYFPSGNPLADQGPPNLQNQTIGQYRSLFNTGVRSDYSYVKGIHNIKAGAVYQQTFLREQDNLSVVAPTFNSPCVDADGNSLPGFSDPSQCAAYGYTANPNYLPVLAPYDLTRGGGYYNYFGRTDVKELALYIEDQIKAKNWLFNLGMRGDLYNGLAIQRQAEPRVGIAYNVTRTNTILRVSYARTLETPFNENLVLSSQGCSNPVLNPLLLCSSNFSNTLAPGFRNEFHAGFQQAFGKYAVVSGEYIWKYTHNAFDFSVLGNTPITFPIDWHNSKIPGWMLRADIPTYRNFSAYVVMSSVAARFFPPQIAGAGATVATSQGGPYYPFRIDHDEKYNQTTHLQYQIKTHGPWLGFNWRYDSGLVAGAVPCYGLASIDPNTPCDAFSTTLNGQPAVDLSSLTADQEFEAGLMCNGVKATPTVALPTPCPASEYSSSLVRIPAPNTGNNDHNPQRIAGRSLFDAVIGQDNIFRGDRYRWSAQVQAINFTNKYALYNFLSTFSGTHYVTPRAVTGQIAFHF
ncbi:MAG TPA: TonB-dependent receptor [Silvibacterium sp.]|nr:TonB-dependent receptor [Silvibacterium sp.]